MDGQIQRTGSGGLIPNSSTLPRRTTQQPLSCTHCRQRKIKCDKSNPCSNCKRSGLDCVFPERVRHPKKRRDGSKANNEELLRRLGRMEELIEKLKVEGKDIIENKVASSGAGSPVTPESKGPVFDGTRSSQETGMDVSRFIGSGFWRSLTNEVDINQSWPAKALQSIWSDWLTTCCAIGRRATANNGRCLGWGRNITKPGAIAI